MKKLECGIYVDIDSILDTRIGTLAKMGDEVVLSVLQNDYHKRMSDFFKDVDLNRYHDLFRDRDIETLYNSYTTIIPELLTSAVFKSDKVSIAQQINESCKVYINTFPYDENASIFQSIATAIGMHLGITAEVQLINVDPVKMSIDFCNQMFSAIFMYDYREWIYERLKELSDDKNMRELTLFSPALYHEKEPTAQELEEVRINPFKSTQMTMAPLIQIEFLDAKVFSIKDIKEYMS